MLQTSVSPELQPKPASPLARPSHPRCICANYRGRTVATLVRLRLRLPLLLERRILAMANHTKSYQKGCALVLCDKGPCAIVHKPQPCLATTTSQLMLVHRAHQCGGLLTRRLSNTSMTEKDRAPCRAAFSNVLAEVCQYELPLTIVRPDDCCADEARWPNSAVGVWSVSPEKTVQNSTASSTYMYLSKHVDLARNSSAAKKPGPLPALSYCGHKANSTVPQIFAFPGPRA